MEALVWVAFILLVLGLLALDLGVFHRKDHVISIREALAWTGFWIALALAFSAFVFLLYENQGFGFGVFHGARVGGSQAALQFLTGFLVEKSLSVDNIFVIAMIFSYFAVPLVFQHRVLYWGILGALVLRGAMIGMGAALMASFGWMVYVFGALLLLTAVKLLVARHDNLEPEKNPLVRLLRRVVPVSSTFRGHDFFIVEDGRRGVTPLFVALVVVESSDVLFAVDSIPAIFAITADPFIVFTSNVFAILGLRSLYFAIAGMIDRFRYLKTSLVFLLAFIGVKMILSHHHPIPTVVSLSVILGILGVGTFASVFASHRDTALLASPLAPHLEELTRLGLRQARRVAILVTGTTVLLVGIAMIVLPGPAFVVIPAGLAILAVEFVWARRWLCRVRQTAWRARAKLHLTGDSTEPDCIDDVEGMPEPPSADS